MKLPVVNRKHYIIYLEYFEELHWLHTDVSKWSANIKKDYVKDLNQLQSLLNVSLFALIDNTKLEKFARTIGFNYLQDLLGNDNKTYKVYKRSL